MASSVIDALSRLNNKNFVNLIGYFFEHAPNGTLFEHLHVKEMEHLDWSARVRVIMGVAYCLQYTHHDLNPPSSHSNLSSKAIFLTDDYAAKKLIASLEGISKLKSSGNGESQNSELPPIVDPEVNVHSYGILLIEIISGKLPYSAEHGAIEKWLCLGCLVNFNMIDPTLESLKDDELEVICDVINECITSKLRQGINIPPEHATPRLSPTWWAELEILSMETT
ncbi:hypothetical protein GOBAR_AA28798 [Gossypium barbadense]|uniref:Protein kinase domain-containing protein n=1 Tax=Gossypium barbadense TaxID=3634 RepID=A0A2P5WLC8_GOSBA|nr:hypothetical protein GOBAR_AA28798 [Gossypium barbadense]